MYTQQNIFDVMTPEEFEKHAIIKPPESSAFVDNDKRYTRLVVDSMFRDKEQYPNPNNYYFVFDDDINDVCSAKLISIDIPFSSYIINQHFNTLYVKINDGNEMSIQLTQGNYTASQLATMLEEKLLEAFQNVNPNYTFTVTYNTSLDSFTFTSSISFMFIFEKKVNSLEALLGFRKQNYSSVNNVLQAPYRCNLEFNNYIVMCIDSFDNNKSNAKPLNKSFAVITKKYRNLNIADDPSIVKNFNPPMARLPRIHISFFDRYGNPYDFQNMDHRFELLFQSFKQLRKYQNIFGVKNK